MFALIDKNLYTCNVVSERNGKVAIKNNLDMTAYNGVAKPYPLNPTTPVLVNNLVWLPKEDVKTAVEWFTLGYKINIKKEKT
tara:strand:- start:1124 stop:1369 length:246 start_codon:yes stop_codon:yes gene_type:complete